MPSSMSRRSLCNKGHERGVVLLGWKGCSTETAWIHHPQLAGDTISIGGCCDQSRVGPKGEESNPGRRAGGTEKCLVFKVMVIRAADFEGAWERGIRTSCKDGLSIP